MLNSPLQSGFKNQKAGYIDSFESNSGSTVSKNYYLTIIKVFFSFIAVAFLLVSSAFTIGGNFRSDFIAFADDDFDYEEEATGELNSLLNDNDVSTDADGFGEMMDNTRVGGQFDEDDEGSMLGAVLHRIIGPGYYLNDTEFAVNLSDYTESTPDFMCYNEEGNPEYPVPSDRVGTPHYHNCAIPNMTTNFIQRLSANIFPMGVQSGVLDSASTGGWFSGTPNDDKLPDEEVPVDPSDRSSKYTALEVFGYGMSFTNYAGEWDHVEQLTEGNLLRRMGHMDRLIVGAQSLWNGLNQAVSAAVDGAADAWNEAVSDGNLLTTIAAPALALWGGITSAADAFAGATIKTFLDTDDFSIMDGNAWHRPANSYPSTVYGTAYLSDRENSIQIQIEQNALLNAAWQEIADDIGFKTSAEFDAVHPTGENFPSLPDGPDRVIADADNNGEDIIRYKDVAAATEIMEEDDEGEMVGTGEYECSSGTLGADIDHSDADSNTRCYERDDIEVISWEEWMNEHDYFDDFDEMVSGSNHQSIITAADESLPEDPSAYIGEITANMERVWVEEQEKQIEEAFVEDLQGSFFGWMRLAYNAVSGRELGPEIDGSELRTATHPASRFVCLEDNGDKARVGSEGIDYHTYEWVYPDVPSTEINSNCNITEVRPPIQGALLGDGHVNFSPGNDTRRELYDQTNSFANFVNMFSNGLFGINAFIASTAGWLVEFSFSSPLAFLGIDEIVTELLGSFIDSIFFPFVTLAVVIAGIMILWKVISTRSYRQAWMNIALVFGVFFFGVVLMSDEERLVQWSDDVPTAIENYFVSAAFGTATNESDNLCTVGSSTSSLSPLDSDEVVRTMMCQTWRTLVFSPWVYGQFGTTYEQLNDSNMQNLNGDLVGDAAVRLGPGTNGTANNWALYQLYATTSGTTTNQDNMRGVGYTDANIYRLVDLQAGPNNGVASDSRFVQHWAGISWGDRLATAFMSIFVSIFGLLAIFLYGMLKIQYSLLITLLLLALPLMFLIGMEPTVGRRRLKDYLMTFVALILKNGFLAFAMALMMILVANLGNDTGDGYFSIAVSAIIIFGAFIYFRKNFLSWVQDATESVSGATANFAGASSAGDTGMINKARNTAPGRVAERAGSMVVGGAIGGAIADSSDEWDKARAEGRGILGSGVAAVGGVARGTGDGFKSAGNLAVERARQGMRQSSSALNPIAHFSNIQETYNETRKRALDELNSGEYDNATISVVTADTVNSINEIRNGAEKLGIDLDKDVPISQQSDEEKAIRDAYHRKVSKYDRLNRGEILPDDLHELRNRQFGNWKDAKQTSTAIRAEKKRLEKEVEYASAYHNVDIDYDEDSVLTEERESHIDVDRYAMDRISRDQRRVRNDLAGKNADGVKEKQSRVVDTQAENGHDVHDRYHMTNTSDISDLKNKNSNGKNNVQEEAESRGYTFREQEDAQSGDYKISIFDDATGYDLRVNYDSESDAYNVSIIAPDNTKAQIGTHQSLSEALNTGYNQLGEHARDEFIKDEILDENGWTEREETKRIENTNYQYAIYDYNKDRSEELRALKTAQQDPKLSDAQKDLIASRINNIERSRIEGGKEQQEKVDAYVHGVKDARKQFKKTRKQSAATNKFKAKKAQDKKRRKDRIELEKRRVVASKYKGKNTVRTKEHTDITKIVKSYKKKQDNGK